MCACTRFGARRGMLVIAGAQNLGREEVGGARLGASLARFTGSRREACASLAVHAKIAWSSGELMLAASWAGERPYRLTWCLSAPAASRARMMGPGPPR